MKYLAITQKTADWLLTNTKYLEAIKKELPTIVSQKALSDGILVVGSLRVATVKETIALWNTDYLTGTGYEEWGFVRIQGLLSLFDAQEIFEEVFEREIYVINQRLQNLLLSDDRYIHRSLGGNMHSCLAGRGDQARQFTVGWYEGEVTLNSNKFHSLVVVGPSSTPGQAGFDLIKKNLLDVGAILPRLVSEATSALRSGHSRPTLDIPIFVRLRDRFSPASTQRVAGVSPIEEAPELATEVDRDLQYTTFDWTYDNWVKDNSPLNRAQRAILESDIVLRQPLRIVGPAGSGKTLLMQLLAMRYLETSRKNSQPFTILYVVHNAEMQSLVCQKFEILGGAQYLEQGAPQKLTVSTLFAYCREQIEFPTDAIIDKDALQTKLFQKQIVSDAIQRVFLTRKTDLEETNLLNKLAESSELLVLLAELIVSEIGIGIKGRGLTGGRSLYVEADRPFTRFHGILNQLERNIVFDVFEDYHRTVFQEYEVLDADDVAISLLGQLKTPLWEMKRKKVGFDLVFVDETQLFNQNERQLFRFLPKRTDKGLPIAIAIDEAQELRGSTNSGFGVLGIEQMASESLQTVHRCTPDILKLAFFVIQRTTDLFGSDFPDFTQSSTTMIPANHPLSTRPRLVIRDEAGISVLGKSVLREIRTLRRNKIRQIAVIVHSEKYWSSVIDFLKQEDIRLYILERRGERLDSKAPMVYVSRPENIGGQEFDGVICVGLEHGVVPPLVEGHIGIGEALEQQSLREMYLAFTRARYQLVIVNTRHSTPNHVLQMAVASGILQNEVDGTQADLIDKKIS